MFHQMLFRLSRREPSEAMRAGHQPGRQEMVFLSSLGPAAHCNRQTLGPALSFLGLPTQSRQDPVGHPSLLFLWSWPKTRINHFSLVSLGFHCHVAESVWFWGPPRGQEEWEGSQALCPERTLETPNSHGDASNPVPQVGSTGECKASALQASEQLPG